MEQNFNEIAIFYFEMGIVSFEREMRGQCSIQVTYCTCYFGVLYGKYVPNNYYISVIEILSLKNNSYNNSKITAVHHYSTLIHLKLRGISEL